jgi:hypothetical protein
VRLQGDGRAALLRRLAQPAVSMSLTRLTVAAAILLAAASSCAPAKDDRACPSVEVVRNLNQLVQFQGTGRDPSDVLFVAQVNDVQSTCKYEKAGPVIDMTVILDADRGRAGARLPAADVTYFIAITDGKGNIITKRNFSLRINFDDKGHGSAVDELTQEIFSGPLKSVSDHTIIVGFQLTPEQIDINERQRGS